MSQALQRHAQRILADADHLTADLSDHASGIVDVVRLVANTSAVTQFLPADLSRFAKSGLANGSFHGMQSYSENHVPSQAFEGLRIAGRTPWRRETAIATADPNVLTTPAERVGIDAIADPLSRAQVQQLDLNCKEVGVTQFCITSRHLAGAPTARATVRE